MARVPTPDIDPRAEIAAVQRELTCFRDECLPAFLGGPTLECVPENASPALREHIVTVAGTPSAWRRAALRLAEYLPLGPLPKDALALGSEDFGEFLFQAATPSFAFGDGRIVWRIELFMPLEMALRCPVFCDQEDDGRDPREKFLARLQEVKKWLMGLPVEDCTLWNALCVVLPPVADADPAFAKLALDPGAWRALVLADRSTDEERRTKRLNLIDGYFGDVLNNALLHVLGGLGSNHFMTIRDYLDHPNLRGSYTCLMPHYLFAVLFEKVRTLRRLSQERQDLWRQR